MKHRNWFFLTAALLLAACAKGPQVVDNAALANEQDGSNWPSFGRTFSETHYSPLTEVNTDSVKRLGLAWTLDLDVTSSITAPLAVNGVIYLGAGHGVIHAIEAKTGRLLWRHDAKAMESNPEKLRVAWGIRGVAFWKDKVYAGTSDGRLIALNAKDGTEAWSAQTVDPKDGAVITGAPRVFNGKVVIGFSGGDFSPLRGYVTAYDAEDGKQLWRFYVVPGKPGTKDGQVSDEAMAVAEKTWTGEWWKYGGGGSVWNAMTYDPEFNRLYIGTGNGTPMNWKLRSPQGGDNLFIASVVA
ncbi:MAG: Quinohemoprotein alcohol dehydrogenase, partial [Pseudomonadota bacterium]